MGINSSILFGTLASVLPNLLFNWLYFLDAKAPKRFIKLVYICEGLKFATLALLLSVFLRWPGLQIIQFFLAFLLSELSCLVYRVLKLTKATVT